ncbi:class III lanthionine synthetase LanKC [Microbacterium sp. JB110]|uniref:class III lanthionine synthetase LanKC n=1 Tax=Microbacterium sp. JB110 TaxID=2024477 RepID=UPI00097EE1F7|nr:class III lanthionine synthetase LanKC [Microbacterium sp. JB110]RCS57183.1 hypothetical protein CIK77_16980 [Microbacterium sp. JB110]SJM57315.1 Lanthionine biosynthesis protein LanL [Frigoribacterium sp. JB110]
MDGDVERYAQRQGRFFATPGDAADDSKEFTVTLPADWTLDRGAEWVMAGAASSKGPAQGWKVHISSTPDLADSCLSAVSTICVALGIPFKFLSTEARLRFRNGKTCPRGHAGKFLTIYPHERDLASLLTLLEDGLRDHRGPYVLSDRRWKTAPVFLRYGANVPLFTTDDDGREVPALRRPDGELVPDERGPYFNSPEWAEAPEALQDWLVASSDDEAPAPFEVEKAVKFSNAGGTYVASFPTLNRQRTLLKEARPHAGLDHNDRDAIDRLVYEYEVVSALKGLASIPLPVWRGRVWEHEYAAYRFEEGISLRKWVVANYPMHRNHRDEGHAYLTAANRISAQLVAVIEGMHKLGWAHQDIHPDNVIVGTDEAVTLVDLEYAVPLDGRTRFQDVRALGFGTPLAALPEEIDAFGLRQTLSFMLLPLISESELCLDFTRQTRRFAPRIFGPDAQGGMEQLLRVIERYDDRVGAATGKPLDEDLDAQNAFPADLQELRDAASRGLGWIAAQRPANGRRCPIHPYGLARPNLGLAYGDAAIEWIRGIADPRSVAGESEYLCAHLRRIADDPALPVGLFNGVTGDLLALSAADSEAVGQVLVEADELVQRLLESTGTRIYDGSPGVLLGLLRLAGCITGADAVRLQAKVLDTVRDLTHAYDRDPSAFAPLGKTHVNRGNSPDVLRSGLLFGHLGLAWLFAEAAAASGNDRRLVDFANAAMLHELSSYEPDGKSGSLQLLEGNRLVPYLATGSAGFGCVLDVLDRADVASEVSEAVPQLWEATNALFCVFPGLLYGHAGLALGGAGLARHLGTSDDIERTLPEQIALHGLALRPSQQKRSLVFAGDSGLRLTADLASGSAGIVLALDQLTRGSADFLPYPSSRRNRVGEPESAMEGR